LLKIFGVVAILIASSVLAAAQGSLTILEDSLPQLSSGMDFHVLLHASGGAPPYQWKAANGDLPAGLTISEDGMLQGRPTKAGDLTIDIMVSDSAHPAHNAEKVFHASVSAALTLDWLMEPKVQDGRIDGSVEVTNGSHDRFDLTVIIVAVASDTGRATAIGYEHEKLSPGGDKTTISFGNTLPPGNYVIHADAIAEIPERNNILRQRLQTPQALQVVAGP
jgi:Putative Ig domain